MFYVYCLRSLKNGNSYIGLTSNIDRRIEARKREKYLKSGVGRE